MSQHSDRMQTLFQNNPLFEGYGDSQFKELDELVSEIRHLAPEDCLTREGDEASEIYFIEEGHVEVILKDVVSGASHAVATLGPGECVGEIALLDDGPRSATIKSVDKLTVSVVPIAKLNAMLSSADSAADLIRANVARRMATRMRSTNESNVRNLQDMLEEAERRVEMGKFMSRVLIGTCLYTFALGALKGFSHLVPDTTFVSGPLLVMFALALYYNIKTSIYPASDYGFTTRNWQPAVKEALLFSVPWLFLAVFAKWLLITFHPSFQGMPLLDFYQSRDASVGMTILAVTLYATFAPIQEMIARSGMQSSFQMFLSGKYKTFWSIFLSTLLFSSTHLHVSFTLAILVFPLGLFWGWLYSRHPTLIGVSISHVLIGCFGLFIVGFFSSAGS